MTVFEKLQEIVNNMLPMLVDVLVYAAIGLAMIVGFVKCVMPVLRGGRALRRGVRKLENTGEGERPAWQESRFLGRSLTRDWQRFLLNAEQLDARGMGCDVEEFINEDTVVHAPGNAQLAEVIPSMFTSLGILGTFIGLMRGISSLDMSSGAGIMEGIPILIEGMRFAFGTSVAGIACAIVFNILYRMAVGRAYKSISAFTGAFSQMAMKLPLNADVQLIVQNQDQNQLIMRASEDIAGRVAGSVETALGRALHPMTVSMDNFIMGATREQISGIAHLVAVFTEQMNGSLNGQFLQLGQTLSAINQSQALSHEELNRSMEAGGAIVQEAARMQQISAAVMERFEAYIGTLESVRREDREFENRTGELLSKMHTATQQQSATLVKLQEYQTALQSAMQDYAVWSDRVLTGLRGQAGETEQGITAASREMEKGSELLSRSYSTFVENISEGLARALGLFDENMNGMIDSLNETLKQIAGTVGKVPEQLELQSKQYGQQVEGYVSAMSQLQKTVAGIAEVLGKKPKGTP